jgi:prepilin signal peptidase PulO-like enzyme (type II secretory pathway)
VRDRLTYWILAIGAVASIGTWLTWRVGGPHWRALLSALIGVAAGGGLVWAVRIVGTRLLGREAMGFGDVTLLAMIGAYLGWQPCLVIFFLAPLAGAVIGAIQWVSRRQSEIRFGPFLCLAAWVTILRWATVWDGISDTFLIPWLVPAALFACLLLMVPLLWLVRFAGDRIRGSERPQ